PCPAHAGHHTGPAKLVSVTSHIALTRTNGAPLAVNATVAAGEPVLVAGLSPSAAPWDALAVFEWDKGGGTSEAQTNAFTVMGAHLIGDFDKDWTITAYDVTNSLPPPPDGLVVFSPSGGSRLISLDDHIDLPGEKVLSFESDIDGIFVWDMGAPTTGIAILHPGEAITNDLPGRVCIETWSPGGGTATLTYTFTGAGAASNLTCSTSMVFTYVNPNLRLEMLPGPFAGAVTERFHEYRPGHHAVTNDLMTYDGETFVPQQLWVVADVWKGFSSVRYGLSDLTGHDGFCANAATGLTGAQYHDFGFHPAVNSTNVTAYIEGGRAKAVLYCRDYGAYCKLTAEFLDARGEVLHTLTEPLPLAGGAASGNHIANAWRDLTRGQWAASGYGGQPPALYRDTDFQPAALGNARTDDPNLTHGAAGDGLTAWQEYRGFAVGGGKDFIGMRHTGLSPLRKSLLVQVMAEDDYTLGLGTGAAVNAPAVQAFNVNAVMQDVAQFYSDPTRGLGIDLYWTVTPFTMPSIEHTYTNGEFVLSLYKHTGTNYYTASDAFPNGQMIADSTAWIYRDDRLRREDRDTFRQTFGDVYVGPGLFIQKNRNDVEHRDFIKIALPSRIGTRERDGQCRYMMDTRSNAANNRTSQVLEARGAYVNAVNVSEEMFLKTGTHISSNDFIDLIKFCIAHELFHLIGGSDRPNATGFISGPPPYAPFTNLQTSSDEIQEINLPARFSILPQP
ncbi:MAG: hypothetical protein FWG50_14390, partial [Kiritimatiellaeota bacterium]|nr:hypothetical protein [Kiritimatiellota bacterium]